MRRICLMILLSISLATAVGAQNNLPTVYQRRTDTTLFDTLENKYWQLLEDKEGRYTFNEIVKPPLSNEFHFNHENTLERDFRVHGYWVRFVLKNTMDRSLDIFLGDADKFQNDYSDFYLIDTSGKMIHYRNGGGLTPW